MGPPSGVYTGRPLPHLSSGGPLERNTLEMAILRRALTTPGALKQIPKFLTGKEGSKMQAHYRIVKNECKRTAVRIYSPI